ncbi:MAG TPA: transporter [Micromonosporaceae bacterium]|jgi:hypothetical protein
MTRVVLVLVCVAVVALALWGMRAGWRNRMTRQATLPRLPVPPDELGAEQIRVSGLYVGTTFSSSWQDRVVHDGLGPRADADAVVYPSGTVIERAGAAPVFIPAAQIVMARLAPGLAGKVTGAGGLLVVRWLLGDVELDTAFRADDKTAYQQILATINREVRS